MQTDDAAITLKKQDTGTMNLEEVVKMRKAKLEEAIDVSVY